MPQEQTDPAKVRLENVRLSFPHLFKPHSMEAGKEDKFSAVFLMDNRQHGPLLDRIEALAERMMLDKFKKKVKPTRNLIRDGNEKSDMEGYGDGISFLTASSKIRRPVVDRMRNPLTEEDGVIYAGCYVNASIRLWVQDNSFGKSVNAELLAIQFVKDGESFGAGQVDPDKEFDVIDGEVGDTGRSRQRSAPAPTRFEDL